MSVELQNIDREERRQSRRRFASVALLLPSYEASRRGMTLIEILIVLSIVAMVGVAVAGVTFNQLANARIKTAEVEVNNLDQAVMEYRVYLNEYPQSLDQLTRPPGSLQPIRREVRPDPWGNDWNYTRSGRDAFSLCSNGPDGRPGTEDDICSENSTNR